MSRFLQRDVLQLARTRGAFDNGGRTFHIKDYLGPRGRYPYDDLPGDLDACFLAGESVYVLDVPRLDFEIIGSQIFREAGYERPWQRSNKLYYQTAWDAVLHQEEGKRSSGKKK